MTTNDNNADNSRLADMFSEENLRKIPNISGERITAIMDYCKSNGYPRNVEQFAQIPGIGTALAQQLQEHFYGNTDNSNDGTSTNQN